MTAVRDYWRGFGSMGRDARLWVAAWGLGSFGGFGVLPVLLNLYLLRLGHGPGLIGLLQGLGQVGSLAMCLPGVAIGRRLGHRNAMLVGFPLMVLGSTLILLSEGLPQAWRPTWLVGSWMLMWAGVALFIVNADPYIMRVTTPETRRYAFAGQQAAVAASSFGGALLGGWLPGLLAASLGSSLDAAAPYGAALLLAPAAFIASILVLLAARREPELSTEETALAAGGAPLRRLLFVGGLIFAMRLGSGATTFVNVYLDDALAVPTVRIGALMGVAELAPIALAALIPFLLGRWGAGRTLGGAAACTALAFALLALAHRWQVVSLAYVIAAMSVRVHFSTRSLFSQESVAPRWRGTVAAGVEMGSSLGMATAASLGGYLIVGAGYRWLFIAAAAVSLVAVGMLALHLRRPAVVVAGPAAT
jgi:MFS family permease